MTRFADYIGTPFLRWVMPIIPVGASLSPTSKIDPAKIGKIPGERKRGDLWVGFKDWQLHRTSESDAGVFDNWFRGRGVTTIGCRATELPGIDVDADDREVAALVITEALLALGNAPKRGRPNSDKFLLMYRWKEGTPFIRKRRIQFRRPGEDEIMAVEVLGQGQHYLVDGMHPSGVEYEWDFHPLEFGHSSLTEIDVSKVGEFLHGVVNALTAAGFEIVKGGIGSRTKTGGVRSKIDADHPGHAPNLEHLKEWLQSCPCDDPEFETRDDWLKALSAIKAASGGALEFFDEYVWPWCERHADNEYDYVLEVWESIHDSALGWPYLLMVAGAFHWMPADSFEPVEIGEEDAGEIKPPVEPDEDLIAAEFVKRHALQDWVFSPHGLGGTCYHCEGGIWREDNLSMLGDVLALCARVGDGIRTTPGVNATALRHARTLHGFNTANAVTRLVRQNRAMHVDESAFNARPYLIGVPGGYVDERNILRAPDPGLLITRCMKVRPDFNAASTQFDALLGRMCSGEADMIEAILRAFGYALCGTGQEQLFWYFHGIGGTGKTTLLETVGKVVGSYGAAIDHEIFMRGSGEKRFGTSLMAGRWFLYSSEIDEGQEWAETTLKTASGGGMMPIERKYHPGGLVPVRWGLFFQGNHWPRFRKVDGALMRRYVPVHFRNALSFEDQQRNMANILFESEGPAIAARLLEARARYLEEGMFIAPAMVREREEYSISQDKLGLFIEERVVFDQKRCVSTVDLYNSWLGWLSEIDGTGASRKFGGSIHRFVRDLKQRSEILANKILFERRRLDGAEKVHVALGMGLFGRDISDEAARNFD